MYYVIQNDMFFRQDFERLKHTLDRLELPYEEVSIKPFIDEYEVKTDRTDVFPFGAVKMARISLKHGWNPGSQLNINHDFMVYRDFYKENLLN